jgi:hypothetical protein
MSLSASLLLALALQVPAEIPPLAVVPEAIELAVGERRALQARTASGPAGDADRWFSVDPRVASVDEQGVVTAIRPGTTRITAALAGRVAHATVTVPQLPPTTLDLSLGTGTILAGTGAPLEVALRTALGDLLPTRSVAFSSSAPDVASVDAEGRVEGRRPGEAVIHARAGDASAEIRVEVRPNPAVAYELASPPAVLRTGDVHRFRLSALDGAGGPVSGFRPVWSVSGSGAQVEAEGEDGVFVAERPGSYLVAAVLGDGLVRTARVEVVQRREEAWMERVGRGPTLGHHAGDTWAFEGSDGRDYAIVGTFMHDRAKVFDVTIPSDPVLTDSIQLDARRINDVKIHPNNRIGILTREGASDRRNGIVILDLSNPARPTIASQFSETLTGGVHNVWITADDLVYASHNGTSDLHIIDISDPRNPREVGRWGIENPERTLHDVIVQDGYAYLSYWNDGLITLDVGAGTHGGTPTRPAFVSQFKYPQGNTHTAWRHGRYLFVGDEIFPEDWDPSLPIEARGYVHVLDMTDIENPREVARYEVPEAGVHNFWVENDVLFVGYYQAGLRAVDVSGELRGDLYRQGRELASLRTTDEDTMVPNWPMTWGAQPFKGNIFTSDLNSGLWIVRFVRPLPVP